MLALILQGLFLPGRFQRRRNGREVGEGGGGKPTCSSIPSHLMRDKTLVFNQPGINSDTAEPCRSLNPQIIPLPTQSPPIETKSAENGD